MPLFSPSIPPLIISQTTSWPCTSATRSSIRPSESRIREPASTFSASVLKVVPTSSAVPIISRGVMVSRSPALSNTGLRSTSLAVRIFGPCRSPSMHKGFSSSWLTLRIIAISASFSSCVPCEKFRRTTSTPARTSSRKTVSVLDAGPRVATIFARRLAAGLKTAEDIEKAPVELRQKRIGL